MVERVRDLGEQTTHLLWGQALGEWPPAAEEMTGLDRIAPERLAVRGQVLKEVLERMEPPIDGRGAPLAYALVLNKLRDIAPGDGTWILVHESEKQMKIPPIVIDRTFRTPLEPLDSILVIF